MRPMRVVHQWNLFHKQGWLNERARCTRLPLPRNSLNYTIIRVMCVSRRTKIHDFFLPLINVSNDIASEIFLSKFFYQNIIFIIPIEDDWLIDKMKRRERKNFFSFLFLNEVQLRKNFLAARNKRPDQLCNRDSLDAALMTPYNRMQRRVIGQRLVRDACSSDVNWREECRNLLFDANSSCHPARLLFPLCKDATTITHLRYEARDSCLSQFFFF